MVSIIIPVYNTEEYLTKCLDSIIGQTIWPQIELICVDDASSDNSAGIIKEFCNKYENIRLIELEENKGQANARNVGLSQAEGKYVYFMDSDDVLTDATAIETLLSIAKKYEVDGIVFSADLILEMESRNFPGEYRADIMGDIDERIYSGEDFLFCMMRDNAFPAVVWRQFWKKSFLEMNNIRFENECSPHEDLLFSMIAYSCVHTFGNAGKAIMILLLVLQLSGSGWTFPVEMSDPFFQTINPYLPFTYAIKIMREATWWVVPQIYYMNLLIFLWFFGLFAIIWLVIRPLIAKYVSKFDNKFAELEIIEH